MQLEKVATADNDSDNKHKLNQWVSLCSYQVTVSLHSTVILENDAWVNQCPLSRRVIVKPSFYITILSPSSSTLQRELVFDSVLIVYLSASSSLNMNPSSSSTSETDHDGRSHPNRQLKPYRQIDYEGIRNRGDGR